MARSAEAWELSSVTSGARSGARLGALDPAFVGAEQHRELVTADVVGAAEVQRPGKLELEQLEQRARQVAGVNRRAELVDEEPGALQGEALLDAVGAAVESDVRTIVAPG